MKKLLKFYLIIIFLFGFQDDFRKLYTASESIRLEYRNLQEEYRKVKVELNRLNLKQTEMQGELSHKNDSCAKWEMHCSSLTQRCEVEKCFFRIYQINFNFIRKQEKESTFFDRCAIKSGLFCVFSNKNLFDPLARKKICPRYEIYYYRM